MTKVKFLRGTALGGIGNDANPGDVVDLPDTQADRYIAQGRAVLAEDTEAVKAKPEPKKRGKS